MSIPSFKTYLREVGDAPYAWHWTTQSEDAYTAEFKTDDGSTYRVMFGEKGPHPDDKTPVKKRNPNDAIWHFSFALMKVTAAVAKLAKLRGGVARGGAFGVTNTGDAVRVLSTVVDVLRAFIRAADPDKILFEAADESHERLYRIWMRQLPRHLPTGWGLAREFQTAMGMAFELARRATRARSTPTRRTATAARRR